ncbi:hypothetical protein GQ54DRAFT_301614 [Martensiomyces pterosporus]|nr:hypothetical protein GQ54DRAFT_301614 [Martensiomyces pterosporus]
MAGFSDEPLLLRMDLVTDAFYRQLPSDQDKRLLEIAAKTANINPVLRLASKKEFKRFKKPGHEDTTKSIYAKYSSREEQLLQSGTLDMAWGLKWLFSYVVLLDTPVLKPELTGRMLDVTGEWLQNMAEAGIDEVAAVLPELRQVLEVAREEIPLSRALADQLPGRFNQACSLLYSGELRQNYVDVNKPKWAQGDADLAALTDNQPPQGFGQTDAIPLNQAQMLVDNVVPRGSVCTRSRPEDLRILSVTRSANDGDYGNVLAMVSVFDRERMADTGDPLALRFDEEMAPNLKPGFVIEATLYSLNNGMHYIDQVTMVWPTYAPLDYVESY